MGKFGIRCKDPKNDFITLFSKLFTEECEVRIGETSNTSLSTLSYANDTPKAGKVRVTANISGVTANKAKDNGTCPLTGTGATNTVSYTGTTDVEALLGANFAIS
jgi:lipopolysaccharide export system protein LptA